MSASWNLPDREITPEKAVWSRRRLLAGIGAGALAAAGAGVGLWWFDKGTDEEVAAAGQAGAALAGLFPGPLNPRFQELDRPLTAELVAARYCNFFEFSYSKQVWRYIERFRPLPWQLRVDGLVARPRTFDLDDLAKACPFEERNYRHRCVETWAMAVPWTGFPLAALLKKVEPLPEARYVRFVSFHRPGEADNQDSKRFPWPYTEGLTLAEAANPLTLVATGMYGHALLKQHGAPVRIVVPWKYGFKSAKSVVRIELTRDRPATFWNTAAPHEYGFEANVDPAVPHPRWSQATERMLGTGESRPTQRYNGYGEWVANLYHT